MTTAFKLGFIGLGVMGRPMALNLIKAGYAMTVYARRPEAAAPLLDQGASVAATPADVARRSNVVFSLVTSSADSEQIALGANGIVEGATAGTVLIDMATISPLVTRRIAHALSERGIEHVDAPVSGGPAGAQTATLASWPAENWQSSSASSRYSTVSARPCSTWAIMARAKRPRRAISWR
jgi:2-hydroxy-3-oxopropionate reductase